MGAYSKVDETMESLEKAVHRVIELHELLRLEMKIAKQNEPRKRRTAASGGAADLHNDIVGKALARRRLSLSRMSAKAKVE